MVSILWRESRTSLTWIHLLSIWHADWDNSRNITCRFSVYFTIDWFYFLVHFNAMLLFHVCFPHKQCSCSNLSNNVSRVLKVTTANPVRNCTEQVTDSHLHGSQFITSNFFVTSFINWIFVCPDPANTACNYWSHLGSLEHLTAIIRVFLHRYLPETRLVLFWQARALNFCHRFTLEIGNGAASIYFWLQHIFIT